MIASSVQAPTGNDPPPSTVAPRPPHTILISPSPSRHGGALPLPPSVTAEALYPAVAAALSADGPTRRRAEAALRSAEPSDGYLGSLVTITASPGAAPTDVRWLSAVLVKNAVPRLWRRRPAAGGLAEEEKAYVRATLLGAHGEADPRVAVQVSLGVARIARLDAPRVWPELLPALMAAAGGAVGERQAAADAPVPTDAGGSGGGGADAPAAARAVGVHAMATLGHVLREMASRRLAADRRVLAAAAPDILGSLLTIWEATLGRLPLAAAIAHDLRVVSLCFKCTRRLVEHAVDSLAAVPAAGSLFSHLLGHRALFFTPHPGVGAAAAAAAAAGAPPGWAPLGALAGGAKALPVDAAAAALAAGVAGPVAAFVTGRLSEVAAKLVVAAQAAHPVSFGPYLPPFLDAYTAVVAAHEGGVGGGPGRDPPHVSQAAAAAAAGAEPGSDAPMHTALAFWATSFLRNVATCDAYAKAGVAGRGACRGSSAADAAAVAASVAHFTGAPASGGSGSGDGGDGVGGDHDAAASAAAVAASAAAAMVSSFFSDATCTALAGALLTRVLPLSSAEVLDWADDPEAASREEDSARWAGDSLRTAGEALLVALLDRSGPSVAALIRDAAATAAAAGPAVAERGSAADRSRHWRGHDAVLRAVGVGVWQLAEEVDLRALVGAQLLPLLAAPATASGPGEPPPPPAYRVLRCRAAWLLGTAVPLLDAPARAATYQVLVPIVGGTATTDMALRLAAARSLAAVVEDVSVRPAEWAPYMPAAVGGMLQLVADVAADEADAAGRLLSAAATFIERSPRGVTPGLLDALAEAVAPLWGSAAASAGGGSDGAAHLLRVAVVVLLKRLVEAVGSPAVTAPCRLAPLIIAAIRTVVGAATTDYHPPPPAAAVDPAALVSGGGGEGGGGGASVPSAAHLLEDALELWTTTVRHSPAYTPELDALAGALAPLACGDGDSLRPALVLVDATAVLGGEAFRVAHGGAVVAALGTALGGVRERGVLAILDVVDTLLGVWPPAAAEGLVPLVGAALQPVLAARLGGHASGGRGLRPPSGVVAAAATASALRLAAASPAAFSAALSAAMTPASPSPTLTGAGGSPAGAVSPPPPSEETALGAFLDVAATHLDIMFTARRRRVAVTGWVTLLSAAPGSTALLEALPALVDAVVQVLADVPPPPLAAGDGTSGGGVGTGGDWTNFVARQGESATDPDADGGGDGDDNGGAWDPPAAASPTPDDTRRATVAAADDARAAHLGPAAAAALAAAAAAVGGDAVTAALGRLDPRVRQQAMAQGWLTPT
ncbi:hypothetical protein MMPV_000700 [Pyropia vietnamensis]